MTIKRITLPKCGSCDLAVPNDQDRASLWCHGAPPSAVVETVAIMGQNNEPTQRKQITSAYPPVGLEMIGCAKHPQVRRKLK